MSKILYGLSPVGMYCRDSLYIYIIRYGTGLFVRFNKYRQSIILQRNGWDKIGGSAPYRLGMQYVLQYEYGIYLYSKVSEYRYIRVQKHSLSTATGQRPAASGQRLLKESSRLTEFANRRVITVAAFRGSQPLSQTNRCTVYTCTVYTCRCFLYYEFQDLHSTAIPS